MHFTSVLAVSASLLAVGYAAEPLAFTNWPKDIQAGKPVTLTWAGAATNEPVTLTLRKGNAGDLDDVETITDQAKDGTFTWTPGENVEEGNSYAFQVSQNGQSNYSGLLQAGAKVASVSDASQSGTSATTSAATSDSTSGTTETTETTQSTGTTSKPLISSPASATPSSSPTSTSVLSSTVTANGPFMTSTDIVNGKQASSTAGVQSGVASIPKYSLELVVGALGLLVYLVQ